MPEQSDGEYRPSDYRRRKAPCRGAQEQFFIRGSRGFGIYRFIFHSYLPIIMLYSAVSPHTCGKRCIAETQKIPCTDEYSEHICGIQKHKRDITAAHDRIIQKHAIRRRYPRNRREESDAKQKQCKRRGAADKLRRQVDAARKSRNYKQAHNQRNDDSREYEQQHFGYAEL